jgi:acyl dehydratase
MSKERAPLYYEDLVVGHNFPCGEIVVKETEALSFATRYDPQPFHLDPEAGRRAGFGGVVLSGWLTAALTMRLMVTGGFLLAEGSVGVGIESLQWPLPVHPGDMLSVAVVPINLRVSASRPAFGIVKCRVTTTNQSWEVVQLMTSTVLVPRRSAENA